MAALSAKAGIDTVLLEAGDDCAQDLRVSTFHPPTLEMLDAIDITPTLLERGLKAPVSHLRDRQFVEAIAFDLFGEIEPVLKSGADVDRVARYERRRRTVTQAFTHAFTQAQSIANMNYIKVENGTAHARRRADMQALHDDDIRRRAYLMRQSMFESLEQAAVVN